MRQREWKCHLPDDDVPVAMYRMPTCYPTVADHKFTGKKPLTVIVVGMPRGGTSLAASILDALGVFMGPQDDLIRGGGFENRVFMESDRDAWVSTTNKLNAKCDIWGFKNPRVIEFIQSLPSNIRNPHLLIVSRDPFAVAQRWLSIGHDSRGLPIRSFSDAYRATCDYALQLVDLFVADRRPRMAVSYERMIHEPLVTIRSISQWLHLRPGFDQFYSAMRRIQRGGYVVPEEYHSHMGTSPHKRKRNPENGTAPRHSD